MGANLVIAALSLCALLPGPVAYASSDPSPYLASLLTAAENQELSEQPGWQRLLHRIPVLGRGVQSTIDFPGFFLAPDGKINAAAELEATLTAFFSDALIYDEPSRCRFRARFEWLRQALQIDVSRLPEARCERYEAWIEAIDPARLNVVFASNDLNSPSSMFGHTLLRVDAKGATGEQRLLGYAINYAAQTTREAGVLYAFKGLTGFYQGRFSVMPYYDKVKEYERFEHRDLWEYPLMIPEDALERLMWHLWELRGVNSDYFFFGENCSYQLLSLIEAALPEQGLTARFRAGPDHTIPIDSIRALREAGLLGEPVYRPSSARILEHQYQALSDGERRWTQAYVAHQAELDHPSFTGASSSRQMAMLRVAHDWLYIRYQSGDESRERGLPRARALLLEMSRNESDAGQGVPARPDTAPDDGHESKRLRLGLRWDDDGHARGLLGWRPAYHDRLDPPQGYLLGGELEFLDLQASFADDSFRLDHARILNVQAIAPRDELFQPWSWFATLDARRSRPHADTGGRLGAALDGGGGLAWSPTPSNRVYLFVTARTEANKDLYKGHDFSAGTRIGYSVQAADALSLSVQANVLHDLGTGNGRILHALLAGQWSWGADRGLRLSCDLERREGLPSDHRDRTCSLSWMHYF